MLVLEQWELQLLLRVDLSLTENTPKELFYKLTPVNLNIDADDKRNSVVDRDVINFSTLKISDSEYNGTYNITGIGSTTFTFNLPRQPEKDGYTKNEACNLKVFNFIHNCIWPN